MWKTFFGVWLHQKSFAYCPPTLPKTPSRTCQPMTTKPPSIAGRPTPTPKNYSHRRPNYSHQNNDLSQPHYTTSTAFGRAICHLVATDLAGIADVGIDLDFVTFAEGFATLRKRGVMGEGAGEVGALVADGWVGGWGIGDWERRERRGQVGVSKNGLHLSTVLILQLI